MDAFLIRGGTPLTGTVPISGSKNSALPLLAATLMADGVTTLAGVPRLSDIDSMTKLLGELGCHVRRGEKVDGLSGPLTVEVKDPESCEARYDIVKTMRASVCVIGPMLARRGRITFSIPGGCAIGDRPIDLHLRGLEKLGAKFTHDGGNIVGHVDGRLRGTTVYLGGASGPTVLGTINVMSAATLAEGTTTIVGAACEPEVSDCAALLNKMGANVTGMGGPIVTIEGVEQLTAVEHRVIPDRIEAGTFLIAGAITGGDLKLTNAHAGHLHALLDRLADCGVSVSHDETSMTVHGTDATITHTEFATQPYPGFPTDLQAQLMALLCFGDGMSVITERIFPDRFTHVAELNRMGARIRKEGPSAFIAGTDRLQPARVMCSDLRASAALVLAALGIPGQTRIDRIYHIDRGYESIEQKLAALGADIQRVVVDQ
ncbi:MAG: UDP-N-acetylglucosamine 1-carboxyvinyltransferase [Planctomycetota bacterium]